MRRYTTLGFVVTGESIKVSRVSRVMFSNLLRVCVSISGGGKLVTSLFTAATVIFDTIVEAFIAAKA